MTIPGSVICFFYYFISVPDNHHDDFFAVALAHFIALISPGPDFLLIIKSTLRNSRRVAFGVVSGIATANALYIVLCLAGAGAILAQSVTLMILIKLFGGIFLLFIAWQALRAKNLITVF